jgi:hypothetical protein
MKVLVAAQSIDPDRTSEGICSSKFLVALSRTACDVTCLTAEWGVNGTISANLPWLESVATHPVSGHASSNAWRRVTQATKALESQGAAATYVSRRFNSLVARLSGFPVGQWSDVTDWCSALRHQLGSLQPDVVVTRGAGVSFYPHMAMLGLAPNIPWIANYHDPFPISLYPPPYCGARVCLMSQQQEAWHRRIVARATALTFPSRRLLEWVLKGNLEKYRSKAFVIPHAAMEIGHHERDRSSAQLPKLDPGDFNLVHTGTLLMNRGAELMIQAFLDFLEEAPRERRNAKLVLVGGVHRTHVDRPLWRRAQQHPNIILISQRVRYRDALCLAKQAVATIILEADAEESPFFPGKLSDCLWLAKPIVALTPRRSVISDLLGPEYPLLVAPADQRGLVAVLRRLWDHWRAGRLQDLAPHASALSTISADAVAAEFERVAAWCLSGRGERYVVQ